MKEMVRGAHLTFATDVVCSTLDNGQVERMNLTIKEATVKR